MILNASEIKKLLKEWHFYKACSSISEDGGLLKQKLDLIEKHVGSLDDIDRTIIRMKYYERAAADIVAAHVFMTPRAVYKRIVKAVEKLSYSISGTV